jgi:tryptophan-rich sensory protein
MMEASLFNKKLSLLLLPNVLWTLFATIISIMYYLEN